MTPVPRSATDAIHAFLARPVAGARLGSEIGAAPADALFVFAGGQERKAHAVELWRAGRARALIVSVGRFEWRRFPQLGLPDGGLRALVEGTPYWRRHFFVEVEHGAALARLIETEPFGTRHEARALAALMRERGFRSVIVVTSAVHVRRASLALARAARGLDATFCFETVPADRDPYGPAVWTRTRNGIRVVLFELVKVAIYATLLWR